GRAPMGIAVLGLFAAALFVLSPVLAIVALARAGRLERELRDMRRELDWLRRRGGPPVPPPAPAAPAVVARPVASEPPPVAEPPRPVEPPPPPPRREPPPPPVAPVRTAGDFATNLGPRILVATGALAFVVFLGLFVKYAWDNEWVGPTGRLLSGATVSVA